MCHYVNRMTWLIKLISILWDWCKIFMSVWLRFLRIMAVWNLGNLKRSLIVFRWLRSMLECIYKITLNWSLSLFCAKYSLSHWRRNSLSILSFRGLSFIGLLIDVFSIIWVMIASKLCVLSLKTVINSLWQSLV